MALISLSSERRPKVISVASKTAMGTARAKIHAKFRNRYSKMVSRSSPLPKNRSMARRRKFTKRMKVIMPKEKMKGREISLIKYLNKSRIGEITKFVWKYIRFCFKSEKNSLNFPHFILPIGKIWSYGGRSSVG